MLYEHLGARPRIHPDAVIAPTAVVSGDVEIGPHCQVLHGAVITSEGGPVTLGESVVVMENALLRASAVHSVHIGDHVLIGPTASVSGAIIESEVYLATGTRVFNGAKIGRDSRVRINAVVQVRTVLAPGTIVPIGWVAAGDPAEILPPDQRERIEELRAELDFPGFVFGLDADTPDLMVQLTERYGRSLARHAGDRPVE